MSKTDFPEIGDLFEERYEVVQHLGSGGFATVFRARDRSVERDVAIKFLAPRTDGADAAASARFLREASVFAELQDPHNITMYDFGCSSNGLQYMVFEFVHGEDLLTRMSRVGSLDCRITAHVLTQLCYALREAHDRGVIHRDIKPANVLVHEYDGDPFRVKLIDYGIAKPLEPSNAPLTRSGAVIGTPRYMSPEQVFGESLSPASDLYSLGLLAYEMLVGRPAVSGDGRAVLRKKVSEHAITLPQSLAPASFTRIIDRLLQYDVKVRYQSAADVLDDLKRAATDLGSWEHEPGPSAMTSGETTVDLRPRDPEPPRSGEATPSEPAPERGGSRSLGYAAVLALLACGGVFMLLRLLSDDTAAAKPDLRAMTATTQERAPTFVPDKTDAGQAAAVEVDSGSTDCASTKSGLQTARLGPLKLLWDVYVPPAQVGIRGAILLFHARGSSGREAIAYTGVREIADQQNLVVLAFTHDAMVPDGLPEAVDDAANRFCFDRERVFAIGDGLGALLLREAVCTVRLAAVAIVNHGLTAGQRMCQPAKATPRIRIYGQHNPYFPPDGGVGCYRMIGPVQSAVEIEQATRKLHGCEETGQPWGDFPDGRCTRFDCELGAFVHCEAVGAHQWPGRPEVLGSRLCKVGPAPGTQFPYMLAIWSFFDEVEN